MQKHLQALRLWWRNRQAQRKTQSEAQRDRNLKRLAQHTFQIEEIDHRLYITHHGTPIATIPANRSTGEALERLQEFRQLATHLAKISNTPL